jgi:CDP-6-deoxy-D-xylo-4-hexulose-3-dehydrase
MKRVLYSGSVHDQAEKDAVMAVLDGGVTAFAIGENVAAMEREVATLFGKSSGIMVNSGSSALYLAVELLDLPAGSEVITSTLTFSTDISSLVRAGLVPVLVDVEPDTFNTDVAKIEELITPNTRAILLPNLSGNGPDWDAVRAIADQHDLLVVEDSCDALGHTLRGTPTGSRSHISLTSFANSHIITCAGNGGMVMVDSAALRDRAVMLRRWGRRSEVQFFGSRRGDRNFWEELDGVHYDNQFIFDEVAWNFEPSEVGAAFGLEQLKKLPGNLAKRNRNFARFSDFFAAHTDAFLLPRQNDGVDTAWLGFPLTIRDGAGFSRAALQEHLDARGIDTRTIWTGNVTRQPMLSEAVFRIPDDGLPTCDSIMGRGVLLPLSHALGDDDIDYITAEVSAFLGSVR